MQIRKEKQEKKNPKPLKKADKPPRQQAETMHIVGEQDRCALYTIK
jgi:hypothetical protein